MFPEPVIHIAVEPKTKADQEKMGIALGRRLLEEDPSFRVRTDEESGQTIISGMGELHLEIIVDRMKRARFNVEANVGGARRWPTANASEGGRAGRQVRQAVRRSWPVRSRLAQDRSRTRPGKGYEFVDAIKGGRRFPRIHPAVDKGLRRTPCRRRAGRLPVVDVKVTLFDGSYHDVDSNENAFRMAASMAFKEGMKKAQPTCLSR